MIETLPMAVVGCRCGAPTCTCDAAPLGDRLRAATDMMTALADPVRQRTLLVLAGRELNVAEIVEALGNEVPRPTLSHHLQVMRRAGILNAAKRGREIVYQVNQGQVTGTLRDLVDCLSCCNA